MHSQQSEEAADNQRAPRFKTGFAPMQYPIAFKLSMQPAFLLPTNSPKQHHHSLPFPEGGCDPAPQAPEGGSSAWAPQGGFCMRALTRPAPGSSLLLQGKAALERKIQMVKESSGFFHGCDWQYCKKHAKYNSIPTYYERKEGGEERNPVSSRNRISHWWNEVFWSY